jgi:hypothetical protein
MRNLQWAGGIAAGVEALAYIVGFGVMATLLNPGDTQAWTAADKLAFVLERRTLFELWTVLIYVVASGALLVLAVALHERLKDRSPAMQIATPVGVIWAGLVIASGMISIRGLQAAVTLQAKDPTLAVSTWVAVNVVQDALGGGIEIVGGVWSLMISAVAWRAGALPKALNVLGAIVGVAGILTVFSSLKDLVMVFGLGQIPWFIGLGVVMLRDSGAPATAALAPQS